MWDGARHQKGTREEEEGRSGWVTLSVSHETDYKARPHCVRPASFCPQRIVASKPCGYCSCCAGPGCELLFLQGLVLCRQAGGDGPRNGLGAGRDTMGTPRGKVECHRERKEDAKSRRAYCFIVARHGHVIHRGFSLGQLAVPSIPCDTSTFITAKLSGMSDSSHLRGEDC